MAKFVLMLNRGSETVGEVLEVGKIVKDVKGIGFDYSFHNTKHKFVPLINRLSPICQTTCHNTLFDIIITEALGCFTIMENMVTYDLFATS